MGGGNGGSLGTIVLRVVKGVILLFPGGEDILSPFPVITPKGSLNAPEGMDPHYIPDVQYNRKTMVHSLSQARSCPGNLRRIGQTEERDSILRIPILKQGLIYC